MMRRFRSCHFVLLANMNLLLVVSVEFCIPTCCRPLICTRPQVKFNQALADHSMSDKPRLIDGIVLTKFDTIDDKVRPQNFRTLLVSFPICPVTPFPTSKCS